jgi:hypothetical protein
MWGWVLRAALAVGLDKWAERKAIALAAKLKTKALAKAESLLKTAKAEIPPPEAIIVREAGDVLRPGSVVIRDDKSYRVTKLLMVNKLGAFYEAHPER